MSLCHLLRRDSYITCATPSSSIPIPTYTPRSLHRPRCRFCPPLAWHSSSACCGYSITKSTSPGTNISGSWHPSPSVLFARCSISSSATKRLPISKHSMTSCATTPNHISSVRLSAVNTSSKRSSTTPPSSSIPSMPSSSPSSYYTRRASTTKLSSAISSREPVSLLCTFCSYPSSV